MNVGKYIEHLETASNILMEGCLLNTTTSDGRAFSCARCPMQKAEGKACPVQQVSDIKRTLMHAVSHGVHGITSTTPIDDPMVVLLIKRAVVLGYSVYTLRYCDDGYIKLRNLLPIDYFDASEV